jgi:hypothetical protein
MITMNALNSTASAIFVFFGLINSNLYKKCGKFLIRFVIIVQLASTSWSICLYKVCMYVCFCILYRWHEWVISLKLMLLGILIMYIHTQMQLRLSRKIYCGKLKRVNTLWLWWLCFQIYSKAVKRGDPKCDGLKDRHLNHFVTFKTKRFRGTFLWRKFT